MDEYNQIFWIICIISFIISVPLSINMNEILHKKCPEAKPYTWGYYVGWIGILSGGCLTFLNFIHALNTYGRREETYIFLGFFSLAVVFSHILIVARHRYGWMMGIILQLNPLLWIINGIYLKNRWAELENELSLTPILKSLKDLIPRSNQSNSTQKTSYPQPDPTPSSLIFQDSERALEYACKFLKCPLQVGSLLPAIVVDSRKLFGTKTAVKIREDGSQLATLRVASDDGGFIVAATTAGKNGPQLKPGDLVGWQAIKYIADVGEKLEDERFGWAGVIVGTLKTEYEDGSWVGNEKFSS